MSISDMLWMDAASDHEAEARSLRLTAAKVSTAEFWPFLALATSPGEFEHRLAIALPDITARVDADLQDAVVATLRENYRVVTAGDYGNDPDGWADRRREMYPEIYDPAGDYADGTKNRDDPKPRGTINGADYDAIQKHLPDGSPYKRKPKQGERRKLDPNDPADAYLLKQRQRGESGDSDDEGDRAWNSHKEGAWYDEGGAPTAREGEGDGDDMADGGPGPGGLWDELSREVHQPPHYDQGLSVHHPSGWSAHVGEDGHVQIKQGAREQRALTFFHAGSGRWVTAAAEQGPGNPYYPDTTPEAGPNQGQTGQFPMAQPDPPNRTLDQYDHATPGNWAPEGLWIERGNAAQGMAAAGARRTAAPEEMGYWHDGQQNPNYFDQGSEGMRGQGDPAQPGLQGNPDAGGLASGGPDGTQVTSEPIPSRADWYGEMTDQGASQGETSADGSEAMSYGQQTRATGSRLPFGRRTAAPGEGFGDDDRYDEDGYDEHGKDRYGFDRHVKEKYKQENPGRWPNSPDNPKNRDNPRQPNQRGRNPFGEPIYQPPKSHPSRDESQYGPGHNPSYMAPRSGQDPTLDAFMRKNPGSSNVADYERGAKMYPWFSQDQHSRETLHPHDDAVDDFDAPGGTHHHPYGNPQDAGGYVDHYRPEDDKINQFNRLSSFDPSDPAVRQLMRHSPGRSLQPIETHEMTREIHPPDGAHDVQPGQFDYPYVREQPRMHAGEDPEEAPHPTGWAVHKFDPWIDGVHGDEFDRTSSRRSFFDPHDASVRVLADDNTPQAGDSASTGTGAGGDTSNTPQNASGGQGQTQMQPNAIDGSSAQAVNSVAKLRARLAASSNIPGGQGGASTGGDTNSGGSAPQMPPQMQQGGPGAEASPPMQPSGIGQPGGMGAPGSGNVPQTTKPRQTPSGGGGAPGMPGGGAGAPGGAPGGSPGAPKTGGRFRPVAIVQEVGDADDPTGFGDPYKAKTAPNQVRQRPRLDMEDSGFNTPQSKSEAIPTTSSPSQGPGTPGREEEDEDDDRREASLIAARAARFHAQRALAGVR